MVLVIGLEPIRLLQRGILSPLQHLKKASFLPIFARFLPKIARFQGYFLFAPKLHPKFKHRIII